MLIATSFLVECLKKREEKKKALQAKNMLSLYWTYVPEVRQRPAEFKSSPSVLELAGNVELRDFVSVSR